MFVRRRVLRADASYMRRIYLFVLSLLGTGLIVASGSGTAHAGSSASPFTLEARESGSVDYAVIGGSELIETNGYGNCFGSVNSTATLNLPAGATIRRAYLSWYAMVRNTEDSNSLSPVATTATMLRPDGTTTVVNSTTHFRDRMSLSGYDYEYDARVAEITSSIPATPTGNYTVDVTGGWSTTACPYTEENVRAWSMHVIYELPTLPSHVVTLWFGFDGFLNSSTTFDIVGFRVPTVGSTAGSLTYTAAARRPRHPGRVPADRRPGPDVPERSGQLGELVKRRRARQRHADRKLHSRHNLDADRGRLDN